ncbi:MAG: hypothetical protein EBQ89_07155 [Alphaproteobacteria bacterium]|nr:hypothetical protein [Alphaproteobacteria bacterium]
MIRCHLRHLEARCRERGYTLDQVRPCIVAEDGGRITVDETHPAYPRAKPGLGDMVAAGLSAVGITKERVSAALGVKDCGCTKRQEALNAIGRKLGIG